MIARPKEIDPGSVSGTSSADAPSVERPMIADRANMPLPAADSGRKLRNVLILANIAGWVAIIILIRTIFF
jgi:hypothetical protein